MLAQQLRTDLIHKLTGYRASRAQNPYANPIQLLALDVSQALTDGTLDKGAGESIDALIQYLTVRAFDFRVQGLAQSVGTIDPEENDAKIRSVFEGLARNADGVLVPFKDFQTAIDQETLGIVFTAHPTFALEASLYRDMAQLATGRDAGGHKISHNGLEALQDNVASRTHGPDQNISLSSEFALSIEAIRQFAAAISRVREIALEVAADLYPENWTSLSPRVLTVSSWVGFDLDGRSDIGWADSMIARLRSALHAIDRYITVINDIAAMPASTPAHNDLELLKSDLTVAQSVFEGDLAVLTSEQGDDLSRAQGLSTRLIEGTEGRLTSLSRLSDALRAAATDISDRTIQVKLLALASEMTAMGLGLGQVQVRLNASQLNNVARSLLGMEHQFGDKASRRRHTQELEQRFKELGAPAHVGVSSLFAEKTTARRLMMFLRLVLDHVDSETPIRFLVAEAESPISMLTALYFAKLFGVEDKVDLSPLFETPLSLERGPGIIQDLLEQPYFLDYVRKRGRLCIQAGYSDAGRFIGQPGAALAVERVRIKVARLLERVGLNDVQVVIFNTHGESIGRGAHPDGIAARMKYLASPASVASFTNRGMNVLEEVSFQGGDGYVHFLQPDLAYATAARLLESRFEGLETDWQGDAIYEDAAFSLELFLNLKEYQERLVEDPGYAALLSSFGVNMLYPTGSRMMQRQHEQPALVERSHPSQLRAIPHNAILQQLGFPANVLAGMGAAADVDADKFKDVEARSDRLQHVLNMVERAWALSSLDAMGGYLSIYDPQTWLQRAQMETDERLSEEFEAIAVLVRDAGIYDRIRPTYQAFLKDALKLKRMWKATGRDAALPAHVKDDMDLLHAVRQALIQQSFILANRMPRFSSQPQITVTDILSQVIHLDMGRALETLRRAFPVQSEASRMAQVFEDSGFHFEGGQDYVKEHTQIFEPLEQLYGDIRRIGVSLSHFYRAIG